MALNVVCCETARRLELGAKRKWLAPAQNVAGEPIPTFADCDASRFEDDILAAWYCYQSANKIRLDARVSRKDAARLCKFGIEKDVERSDLAVANNDDIQSGIVWGLTFRARAPC